MSKNKESVSLKLVPTLKIEDFLQLSEPDY